MSGAVTRVMFWREGSSEADSVYLSPEGTTLLNMRAREKSQRAVDILREVSDLFGKVTNTNLMQYLTSIRSAD